jgi:hypothetical protein
MTNIRATRRGIEEFVDGLAAHELHSFGRDPRSGAPLHLRDQEEAARRDTKALYEMGAALGVITARTVGEEWQERLDRHVLRVVLALFAGAANTCSHTAGVSTLPPLALSLWQPWAATCVVCAGEPKDAALHTCDRCGRRAPHEITPGFMFGGQVIVAWGLCAACAEEVSE